MKTSSDLKAIALQALRGKWGIAVLAGIIAAVLGGITSGGSGSSSLDNSDRETLKMLINNSEYSEIITTVILVIVVVLLVLAVVSIVVGSVVELGYASFNLKLVDEDDASIGNLFTYFKYTGRAIGARLLRALYLTLWTLLFIIPGIIKSYSYAMTPYILAENPDMTADEAISRSKEMMYGYKWNLFCLRLSFIGWAILCVLTLGIGNLWLRPYVQASMAAFYREVSQTWQRVEVTAAYEID